MNWNILTDKNRKLHVKSGETKYIEARIHPPYSEIIIEKNGVLICENGKSWLMLYSKGNVLIAGKIIVRNFKTGLKKMIEKSPSPDNQTLEVYYPENAKGGKGGDSRKYQRSRQGLGAKPTANYGGGGATGRFSAGCGGDICNSMNATDWKGAIHPNGAPKGGNGGVKKEYQNGGAIYIKCDGEFIGEKGSIDVSGSRGENGSEGEKGRRQHWRRSVYQIVDAGKGGGGAPGADAGHIVIKTNKLQTETKYIYKGGIGGDPGLPGMQWNQSRGIQTAGMGEKGNNGDPPQIIVPW